MAAEMTGRERMAAALTGGEADRPPIWLREGFAILCPPAEADHPRLGWQADPLYRDLLDYVRPHVEDFASWGIAGPNRDLMVDLRLIDWQRSETPDGGQVRRVVHTPRGDLVGIKRWKRGEATGWDDKPLVESLDELAMLAETPWSQDPQWAEQSKQSYAQANARGDAALPLANLPSPIVCISQVMSFELFLELSLTEETWFHELCGEITRRNLAILERVFDEPIETAVNFGGSEQCTPPMMAPEAFEKYVVPYDGQMVRFLKDRGAIVNTHCHGKVARALEGMIEMGVDSTDPVEPPPAGDVTFAEARHIAGDDLTLIGNLEWDELEFAEPEHIRQRVGEILSHGQRRLVLGASAGPISAVSEKLVANYKAWIDEALSQAGRAVR